MSQSIRRIAYVFLCALPFVAVALASARPLRTAGLSQIVGVVLFVAIVVAAWLAGPRKVDLREEGRAKQALAGLLLIVPFAIFSLLWVGLGPPFQATLQENYMRYLVLVWSSIIVTIGFVIQKDVLNDSGERICSTVGLATALTAGAAYLICLNLSLAGTALALHGDKTPPDAILGGFYSAIEFVACVTTYVTTAVFAAGMGRVRLLGRGAAAAYVTIGVDSHTAHRAEGAGVSGDLRQNRALVHEARCDGRHSGDPVGHALSIGRSVAATVKRFAGMMMVNGTHKKISPE
jgi:hypothetical protein